MARCGRNNEKRSKGNGAEKKNDGRTFGGERDQAKENH